MFAWICVLLVLFFYVTFDVHYFVRVAVTCVFAKFFRKKITITDASEIYGVVLPSDTDFLLSFMTNSRYLREYDFARFEHATRSGLMEFVMKRGGSFPVSAIHMRYRQPAMIFSAYKVVTQPVYWDSKFIYLDQRLITLKDNVVRAAGYAKIACVKFDGDETMKKLFPKSIKPEIPADLKIWNDACSLSAELMKKSK
ncbi:protein THEM6 [Folsomia candida]|nr:protein THEM6 [Folsomia candida]